MLYLECRVLYSVRAITIYMSICYGDEKNGRSYDADDADAVVR